MNANDDQSLSILSSIVFLEDELKKAEVNGDVLASAFDIKQQLLQYSHAMNDQLRVARTEYDALHTAVMHSVVDADLSDSDVAISRDAETALAQMVASIITMRASIKRLLKRTSTYCAIAAFAGGIVAWLIPFVVSRF